jgi:hypothetical protein
MAAPARQRRAPQASSRRLGRDFIGAKRRSVIGGSVVDADP